MKIRGTRNMASINPMIPATEASRHEERVEQAHEVPQNAVSVDLSQTSRGLKQAQAVLASLPEVRLHQVAALKSAIEEGSYWVESEKIARRMVNEALRESIRLKRPEPA